jgi:hypothetical protein
MYNNNNKKEYKARPSLSLFGLVGFDNKWWLHNHSLAAATNTSVVCLFAAVLLFFVFWERRGWHGMGRGGCTPPDDKSGDCVSQRNLIFGQIFGLKVAGRQTSQILLHTLCLSLSLSFSSFSSTVLTTFSYIQKWLTQLVVMFHPEC